MHDEDCAIDLNVKNRRGDHWKAYGDKRILDTVDDKSKKIRMEAVQPSANEVYAVWKGGVVPTSDKFDFQDLVPVLDEDVIKNQDLAALLKVSVNETLRRATLFDRRAANYTID